MKEPHERLQELRQARFSTMKDATRRHGLHYQNYRDHEKGRVKISPDQARHYAKIFKSTPEYILFGQEPTPSADGVPVLSWVAAGNLSEAVEPHPPGQADEWIPFTPRHEKVFALEIHGESMNKVSPDGSYIIVDMLQRELLPKGYYVVKIGDSATYKRFYGGLHPRLEAESSETYEPIYLSEVDARVVGRVTHAVRRLD